MIKRRSARCHLYVHNTRFEELELVRDVVDLAASRSGQVNEFPSYFFTHVYGGCGDVKNGGCPVGSTNDTVD